MPKGRESSALLLANTREYQGYVMTALVILVIFGLFLKSESLKVSTNRLVARSPHLASRALFARVQKAEEENVDIMTTDGDNGEGEGMAIPFDGVVGRENGALFDKPLNVYDPLKDTADLPGEDGSPEKIAAIQQRIEDRVAELKSAGEWGDDGDVFGTDPLAKQSLIATMAMQMKACKPFETLDELALTYILVLVTTVTLSVYLVFLRDSFDSAASWFINTDFDFLNSLR